MRTAAAPSAAIAVEITGKSVGQRNLPGQAPTTLCQHSPGAQGRGRRNRPLQGSTDTLERKRSSNWVQRRRGGSCLLRHVSGLRASWV